MCPQQNHLGLSRSRRSKCVRSQIINISTCPPALSGMMDSAGLLSLQRTVRSENIKNLTRSRDEGTCCCRDEDSSDWVFRRWRGAWSCVGFACLTTWILLDPVMLSSRFWSRVQFSQKPSKSWPLVTVQSARDFMTGSSRLARLALRSYRLISFASADGSGLNTRGSGDLASRATGKVTTIVFCF